MYQHHFYLIGSTDIHFKCVVFYLQIAHKTIQSNQNASGDTTYRNDLLHLMLFQYIPHSRQLTWLFRLAVIFAP